MNAVGLGVEAENVTDSVWKIRRMKSGDEQITALAAGRPAVSVNHPPAAVGDCLGECHLAPAARPDFPNTAPPTSNPAAVILETNTPPQCPAAVGEMVDSCLPVFADCI